jgi:2-polyprenyl-3-methyl-5-hydroxy-6-metoxy-1,4-benzoquinol methylase
MHSACPACASPQSVEWGRDKGKKIFECVNCKSIYFSRPIKNRHDYDTYYPYLSKFDDKRIAWEFDQRRRQSLEKLTIVRKFCPAGRTLLDFGAGPGYFCAHAAANGWSPLAVESSIPARNTGIENFSVKYRQIDQIANGAMDAITCFHVLEHLENPQDLLTCLSSKLSSGGILFVHVPNKESLTSRVASILRRRITQSAQRRGSLYFDEHLTGFTSEGLARCAAAAGLKVVWHRQISFFHRQYDPALWKIRFTDGVIEGAVFSCKAILRGVLDLLGGLIGRGDWIAMCLSKSSGKEIEINADQPKKALQRL